MNSIETDPKQSTVDIEPIVPSTSIDTSTSMDTFRETEHVRSTFDPFQPTRHSLIRNPSVRSPISGSLFAILILILFPIFVGAILLIPWQQSAVGLGEVSSFSPANRPQKIEAPIEGQITEWLVSEGAFVQQGDVLVQLQDNDPERLNRLNNTLKLSVEQNQSIENKRISYVEKYERESEALNEKLSETKHKIQSMENKQIGLKAERDTEQTQLIRYKELLTQGIVSTREYELALLKRDKAQSSLDALNFQIDGMYNQLNRLENEGKAKLAEIEGEINELDGKLAELTQKQLEVESKVAKQSTQQIVAPKDGFIFRIEGGIQGEQIKKGDPLMEFVPMSIDRIVELYIDGNDISLLEVGQEVRLVFEGWPALQFVGFPGADAGTFAGKIKTIDATSTSKGKFRILVEPDGNEHSWPEAIRLRQGVRVKGWVLLGTVPLGYELWRRINGFPASPEVDKGQKKTIPVNKKPKKSVLELQ